MRASSIIFLLKNDDASETLAVFLGDFKNSTSHMFSWRFNEKRASDFRGRPETLRRFPKMLVWRDRSPKMALQAA